MGCKITQYKVEKGVFIEVNFTGDDANLLI